MISNIPWPNGARCAVAITLDMDADSLVHLAYPKDSYKKVSTISYLQYGPEVAIPRILETYRRYDIRQSFFIPAWCMQTYPHVVEAILKGGHEIGHHGFVHENPNDCTREEEHDWLCRGIEVFERMTGNRPRGWRAPLYNASSDSMDLLIEEEFLYDASLMGDDNPYILKTTSGQLVEIPSHWGLDDWPPFVHNFDLDFAMPIQAPSVGFKGFREEFDAAWEDGGAFVAPWHPFVVGRRARWKQVEKLIDYMMEKGDIWFARMDEIAAHVEKVQSTIPNAFRTINFPTYTGPVDISSIHRG
jgi:peptidoglycan/xylan/chitin deacetylase (PgdA/CDA1 family)